MKIQLGNGQTSPKNYLKQNKNAQHPGGRGERAQSCAGAKGRGAARGEARVSAALGGGRRAADTPRCLTKTDKL